MIIRTEYKQKCLCSRKKTVILIFILLLIFSGIVVSNLLVKTNAQWEWIIKPGLYKNIAFLDGNLFKFHKNDKEVCIIDASTKDIFEYPLFNDIEFDRENVFIANKNSSFFHVDKAGNKLSDKTYESIYSLKDGFSAVKLNGLWGFIDENFNQVIDFKFYDVHSFYENYAAVMDKDNKWGFIDTAGNVAIDFQYDEVENFREDLAAVRQGDKWGYIDKNGKEVISCKYDEVHSFSEGLAAVAINNYFEDGYMAWAYIDTKGEVVIPFYSYNALGGIPLVIGDFHDGRAFVTKDLVSVIGKNGENIFSGDSLFFISKAEYYKEHSAMIGYIYSDSSMKIKKYGLLNLKGEEVLKPVFDYIESIYGEYMIVADIKNETDMNYGIVRIK